MNDTQVYAGAALMGAVAGMRSMSSPAIISQLARSGALPSGDGKLAFLDKPMTAKALTIAAMGEMVADKLPFLPKRTKAPSLIWRAVAGAFAGAVICSSKHRPVAAGAAIGAAAAVGVSYGFQELRRIAGEKLNVPDAAVAVVEDLIVGGFGALVAQNLKAAEA
jgi:uncharacterized membrane protein